MRVSAGACARWCPDDGAVLLAGGESPASCGGASVTGTASSDGLTLTSDEVAALCPGIGRYSVQSGASTFAIERVSGRYASVADLVDYGKLNNDGFDDSGRFPRDRMQACIQAAEEAIDRGTNRSFCERKGEQRLFPGMNWLGYHDVRSVEWPDGVEQHDPVGDTVESSADCTVTVDYGADCDAEVRRACVQLAASYLRPRASAENVRGQSVDGVYVAYTLASGTEGSWTGLPFVDAVIASHARRWAVVI